MMTRVSFSIERSALGSSPSSLASTASTLMVCLRAHAIAADANDAEDCFVLFNAILMLVAIALSA